MFENRKNILDFYRSPLSLASMALDEIESRLDGNRVIADPNSPFCHLLEFGSSVGSGVISLIDEKLPLIYPHRAVTMEDLYMHMSDFDYARITSQPSQTTMRMMLPKQYLILNALPKDNYKLVVIPKDTVFTIGKYRFGIHYPINIVINSYTNTFTVSYDTKEINPLQTLTKNIVDKYDMSYNGVDYLVIEFPIYQFAKSVVEKTLISATGFAEKITYNNKLYAIRLFTVKDGKRIELGQSQSEMVYDTSRPTALVRPLPDEQRINIILPQVYFSKNILGTKLYIELYTTLGKLDISTKTIKPENIHANFAIKSDSTTKYSAILKNLPFHLTMVLTKNITGGSDPLDLDILRNKVVNDALYQRAPISEVELQTYVEKDGFKVQKTHANVTGLVYDAYKVLRDTDGSVIPSLSLPLRFYNQLYETCSTVKLQSDNSYTILPTAIYRHDTDAEDAVMLNDTEMMNIAKMSKPELVDYLNNNRLFKTPFHMRVNTIDNDIYATSFNLMLPNMNKLIFVEENFDVPSKITVFDARIEHLNHGIGGYKVSLSVYKSDDLNKVKEDKISIYGLFKTKHNQWIYREFSVEAHINNRTIYSLVVETNYKLTDKTISVTNFNNDDIVYPEYDIDLVSDMYLVCMLDKEALEVPPTQAPHRLTDGVPNAILNTHVGLTRQYIELSFGHKLDDVIYNSIDISASPKKYATWDHNVPAVYEQDVYERDEDGSLVLVPGEDGTVKPNKIHSAGEQKLDQYGKPIWLHKVGELRYDAKGEPIVVSDRNKIYYIDTMFIDAKVFASERTSETNFVNSLYTILDSNFEVIRNLGKQMFELARIYFKCVRSTGTARFNMGDGVISKQNVELSFKLRCYVPSYVKTDLGIQTTIKDKTSIAIEEAIRTKTISMLDVFSSVKEKMSDYIDHFTLLGINGDVATQTFVVIDEDAQPSIARKLELVEDNVFTLTKDVDIEFVALEDNTLSAEVEV